MSITIRSTGSPRSFPQWHIRYRGLHIRHPQFAFLKPLRFGSRNATQSTVLLHFHAFRGNVYKREGNVRIKVSRMARFSIFGTVPKCSSACPEAIAF